MEKYDIDRILIFFNNNELEEVVDALDHVLYAAFMYFLDVNKRGIPLAADADSASVVRYLLESLRSSVIK